MSRKKKWKELGLDALFDFAGAFLQAIGIWCFIEPSHVAPGGVSGIALMLNHLFSLPIGTMSLVFNIPLLLASWFLLDREMTLKTIRTVIWMSVVQDFVSASRIWQYEGDRLIACAFGGIFAGVGMALIFMRNSTTGGGDILAKLLQKLRPYMQTGYAIMLVDFVVVGASILVFGEIEAAMYGIISIVCTTQAMDTILYGMNRGSMITVHSEKNEEIAQEIMQTLDRGTTFYKSIGGYSGKEGLTLTCAVDRKQFHLVKEIIDRHDPKAFIIVSPTKETYGEGFLGGYRNL
ncbi:YitT family protein [Clostridium sp. OF09-36]|uniref:YitT family protein n=1 Tax=Clostridium sp. OF09-36 TaxID=2292310 RepID=UPI000E480BD9|nr:YitT family protein [Clostridium sp. OF09-36]RHV89328.1 YitT family protein [Clostridium sp. OF09-36]